MKPILYKLRFLLYTFFTLVIAINVSTVKGQSTTTASCTMLGSDITLSLTNTDGTPLTTVPSGLDFNLNLTLPGLINCNGSYAVTVTTFGNLEQGATAPNYPYQFYASGNPNEYVNGPILPSTGSGGIGINIPFRFISGNTCDGEAGAFKVRIKLTCADNSVIECVLGVNLTATAKNWWKIEKKHVWGSLMGGNLVWDIILTNTNPDQGIGDYDMINCLLTDNGTSDQITSITRDGNPETTSPSLPAPSVQWYTGLLRSRDYGTSNPIVYRVTTTSCQPIGTVIKNCISAVGTLGKLSNICSYFGAAFDPLSCDEVTLDGEIRTGANFSKSLTYPETTLNYAPGCEAEYTIKISNNGNVPIANIMISDIFPTTGPNSINVTQVSVAGYGVDMDYTILPIATGTFNTGTAEAWTTTNPSGLTFSTSSGMLSSGYIEIKIRFTINPSAVPGNDIENCADLSCIGTFDGTPNGTTICGVDYPPITTSTTDHKCATFKVQNKMPKMGMTKCISGNQQTYSVGDPITFKIVISNHGALGYSGNLTDFLGLAQQNLSLVNGSVTYAYGVAAFNPYSTTPGCIDPVNLPFQTQPSWVTVTQQTQQNLEWNISGMPGSCELEKANYLVIQFTATILPQSFGRYHNTATIGTISADAYYNIMRVAKIVTTKTASTAFVELGQQFSYIVTVKNAGSVAIDNIKVEDALPGCATIDWCTANKLNASGVIISTGVPLSCNPPNFTFNPTFTLQPGESIELSIVVTRNANNQDPQCCNPKAKGIGRTTDAVHQWPSDEDGPACVKSSLCCDIKDLNVMFWTNHINGAIVPAFWITSGPVPVQEVDISLMDYHIEYNHPECKPVNIGNLSGHIQPFVGTYGGNWNFYNLSGVVGASPPTLPLQTVINPVNNILTWTGSNPINFSGAFNTNGIVGMNFIAPGVVNLDCCSGKVFYCFKVRIKDVNCNVCEKIVCGSSELPKRRIVPWTNVQAQGKYEIESLKNIERTIQKPEVNKGQNNFGAPGHKKDTIPSKKKN